MNSPLLAMIVAIAIGVAAVVAGVLTPFPAFYIFAAMAVFTGIVGFAVNNGSVRVTAPPPTIWAVYTHLPIWAWIVDAVLLIGFIVVAILLRP
ncbi:MAG: hypothetical protein R3D56_06960 [Paracoccaceae bacterium]